MDNIQRMETDQLRVKYLALPAVIIGGNSTRTIFLAYANHFVGRNLVPNRAEVYNVYILQVGYIYDGPNAKRLPSIVHVHIYIDANCFAICRDRSKCEVPMRAYLFKEVKISTYSFHRKIYSVFV